MSLPGFNAKLIEKPGIPASLWDAKGPTLGEVSFELQVYDITFTLEGLPEEVLQPLQRLRMGKSEVVSRRRLPIRVFKSPHPQFNSPEITGLTYTINFDMREETILFYGYYFAARFSIKNRSFELFMAPAEPDTLAGEVENFLRVATSLFLQFEDVFLFHSSSVSTGGNTFVFFGPHAAGKSTLALLAPEDSIVLGDDLNALVLEDDKLFVVSVPFPSEVTQVRPIVKRRVTALFRIIKGSEFRFETLSKGRKFASLIGSMPVLNKMPDCIPKLEGSIHSIIARAPLCALHFDKTKEVYPWINANLSSIPR